MFAGCGANAGCDAMGEKIEPKMELKGFCAVAMPLRLLNTIPS